MRCAWHSTLSEFIWVYLAARQYFKIIAIIHTFCQQTLSCLPSLFSLTFFLLFFPLLFYCGLFFLSFIFIGIVWHEMAFYSYEFCQLSLVLSLFLFLSRSFFSFYLFLNRVVRRIRAEAEVACVQVKAFCHIVAETKFNGVHKMPLTWVRLLCAFHPMLFHFFPFLRLVPAVDGSTVYAKHPHFDGNKNCSIIEWSCEKRIDYFIMVQFILNLIIQ